MHKTTTTTMKKQYSKKENAFYWFALSVISMIAVSSLIAIHELIEFIFK